MDKKLKRIMIIGYLFSSVIGTIMHFVYQLSGENTIVGLIAPVNESPWEHLKLLFFPFLGFMVFLYFKMKKESKNIFFSAYIGILLGMWSTLAVFYTFNGMLGGNNEIVNITSFFIGMAVAFVSAYILIKKMDKYHILNSIGIIMFAVTALFFFRFTYHPPMFPLFAD